MFTRLCKLNKNLIWGFLGSHARKPNVYARNIDGLVPCLDGNPAYFFATGREVLIVCVDLMPPHSEELADEEPFAHDEPQYFTEDSHRVSPVYRLYQALSLLKQSFDEADAKPRLIKGVLLTTSNIINAQDMEERWSDMGIMVAHSMPAVIRSPFTVESREELPVAKWFHQFEDYCEHIQLTDIVKQFCIGNEDSEDDDDADLSQYSDGHDEDDNHDEQLNFEFPDGEFMLGQNNKVKVEILKPVKNPLDELNRLVGCNDIHKQIDALIALNRYNQIFLKMNPWAKPHSLALHSIFFGRPGTGKTTVCKIYGSLLRDAGMLSKGHVVCCNRGTFVGNNWGDEDKAVRQVIQLAKGGVLMIDEAYLLNSSHPNDPGKLVVPLLMDILANEDMRDIAIVLCGYKDEMLRLIDLNPGLDSRFPNRFEFPDFAVEDLLEITRRRIKDYGYHFTRSAWLKYKSTVTTAYEGRDRKTWGNARYVANLLEHIYLCHARRCIRLKDTNRQRLLSLTAADIQPIETPTAKRHIGF